MHSKKKEKLFNDDIDELRKTILKHKRDNTNMLPIGKTLELFKEFMHKIKTNAKFSISKTKTMFELDYYFNEVYSETVEKITKRRSITKFIRDWEGIYTESVEDFEIKTEKIKNDQYSKDLYKKFKARLRKLIICKLSNKYKALINQKRYKCENQMWVNIENSIIESDDFDFNEENLKNQQLDEYDSFSPRNNKFGLMLILN